MPEGSCFCGKVRIAYHGEARAKVVCHCTDCRKISGSAYGIDLLVPPSQLRIVAGEPKLFNKKADSGRILTSRFCGDCGTTLYRSCDHDETAFRGCAIIKQGVMDDDHIQGGSQEGDREENDKIPSAELFIKQRKPWVEPVKGAEQRMGMT